MKNAMWQLLVCGALAVSVQSESADAQVIQLPSFRSFSYSGAVSVPDSGVTHLGRNFHATTNQRLARGQERLGSGFGGGGLQVSATIIDLEAMDRAILGNDFRTKWKHSSKSNSSARSISKTDEGKSLVRSARTEYKKGNHRTAFDRYVMAIEILNGNLRKLAAEEFQRVFGDAAIQTMKRMDRRKLVFLQK